MGSVESDSGYTIKLLTIIYIVYISWKQNVVKTFLQLLLILRYMTLQLKLNWRFKHSYWNKFLNWFLVYKLAYTI